MQPFAIYNAARNLLFVFIPYYCGHDMHNVQTIRNKCDENENK